MIDKKTPWTPGPWQINGVRHSGDLRLGKNTWLHFVGPDGDPVCAVFFDMKTAKGFADARLIAAAPAMAEALEYCIALLNGDISGEAQRAGIINDARAALALATGVKP